MSLWHLWHLVIPHENLWHTDSSFWKRKKFTRQWTPEVMQNVVGATVCSWHASHMRYSSFVVAKVRYCLILKVLQRNCKDWLTYDVRTRYCSIVTNEAGRNDKHYVGLWLKDLLSVSGLHFRWVVYVRTLYNQNRSDSCAKLLYYMIGSQLSWVLYSLVTAERHLSQ
jgi:hypothetical protein